MYAPIYNLHTFTNKGTNRLLQEDINGGLAFSIGLYK